MIFCRIVSKVDVVQQFYIMARQKFISANILDLNAEISCDILLKRSLLVIRKKCLRLSDIICGYMMNLNLTNYLKYYYILAVKSFCKKKNNNNNDK